MADVTGTFYASESNIGYGSEFLVGQGDSPESFVALPEINKISMIVSMTTPVVDVTHLRSPGRHREKVAGISDSGPITCEGNYRPSHGAHLLAGGDGFDADHNLQALRASAARNNFQIVLPSSFWADPDVPESQPLVGVVTKYEIGEVTLEGKVPFVLEVTPTRAYYSR